MPVNFSFEKIEVENAKAKFYIIINNIFGI